MTRQLPAHGLGGPSAETAAAPVSPPVVGDVRARTAGVPARLVPGGLLPLVDLVAVLAVLVPAGAGIRVSTFYVSAVLVIMAAEGQHRCRLCLRVGDRIPRLVGAAALPAIALLPWLTAQRAFVLGVGVAGSVLIARTFTVGVLRSLHRAGRATEGVLLMGDRGRAEWIAAAMRDRPELGLVAVGLIPTEPTETTGSLPVLGTPADLATLVGRSGATRLIVCSAEGAEREITDGVRRCRELTLDVCELPRLPEVGLAVPRAVLDDVAAIPLIPLRRRAHTGTARVLKRAFDLFAAQLMLVLAAPLLAVLVVAVKLDSAGAAWFRQRRVTCDGAITTVIKLRTVAREHGGSEDRWTVPRADCTRLGVRLRRCRLDELPQLCNVLAGGMSVVGPRPERPRFAERFAEGVAGYADRHRMPAGMTGWAQVHGLCGDTSIVERARFDNQYIEYWSPWMDVQVIGMTVLVVFEGLFRQRPRQKEAGSASPTCDHRVGGRRRRAATARVGAAQSP